jgi:hypothetical protein
LDAILCGVAANALVDDAVLIPFRVEISLEIVGVAFAGLGAVARGEAVAETDDQGTLVVDCCCRRLWSGKRGFGCGGRFGGVWLIGLLSRVIGAAAEEGKGHDR